MVRGGYTIESLKIVSFSLVTSCGRRQKVKSRLEVTRKRESDFLNDQSSTFGDFPGPGHFDTYSKNNK